MAEFGGSVPEIEAGSWNVWGSKPGETPQHPASKTGITQLLPEVEIQLLLHNFIMQMKWFPFKFNTKNKNTKIKKNPKQQ